MRPWLACALIAGISGCHGFFGGRTTEEDQALNNFAEARQRAATYYDGGDYVRAATQYAKALEYKPDHFATRLGYAWSLMATDIPSSLVRAQEEFRDMGARKDPKEEVKRVQGLGLTYRALALHYSHRAKKHEDDGRLDLSREDQVKARDYAHKGIEQFEKVLKIDEEFAAANVAAPNRVSASLAPDAQLGIAHCEIVLGDRGRPEHLERAEKLINEFARTAANARRFWEQRRERLLVTDVMREPELGAAGPKTLDADQRKRYEERIARTVREEVAARTILVTTYHYLKRFQAAVDECTRILELDAEQDEIYYMRARAYEYLQPPDYAAALADMKEYRRRQKYDSLTEKLVYINQYIKRYEEAIAK